MEKYLQCRRRSLQYAKGVGSESGWVRRQIGLRVDEGAAACLVIAAWKKVRWAEILWLATTNEICEVVSMAAC